MSFDTTSVNIVRFNGHMFFWEMIDRELLWLACSQYIIKLILAKVFILCCDPSSCSYISIFKRFKTVWENVTHDKFRGTI